MASCCRPNRVFFTGRKLRNGKDEVVFKNCQKKQVEFVEYEEHMGEFVTVKGKRLPQVTKIRCTNYVEVPCGQCEECKANQAREKAVKAMAEANTWEHNEVINLSYNNENLPTNEKGTPTLRYKDVQDFKKRLLEHYERVHGQKGIKFMCACEYGDKYQRPHYHLIMFNMECKDKVFWGYTKKGSKQWRSKEIEEKWGKGNVTIGEASAETIHYVSNYCVKKFKGKEQAKVYEKLGIEPESVKGSNRRGLGALYFDKHKEEYLEHGKIYVGTENGIQTIGTNPYFDKLLANEYGDELLKQIKEKRYNNSQAREQTRAMLTGVNVEQLRQNEHNQFMGKFNKMKKRNFKELGQT